MRRGGSRALWGGLWLPRPRARDCPAVRGLAGTQACAAEPLPAGAARGNAGYGRLRSLVALVPTEELLGAARKRLRALDEAVEQEKKAEGRLRRGNARGAWGLPQERKLCVHKVQVLSSSVTRPLKEVVDGYRRAVGRLHPFERVVAELTISSHERNGAMGLDEAFGHVARLRAAIGSALKDAATRAAQAESMPALEHIMSESLEHVQSLVERHDQPLQAIRHYARSLRAVPVLDDRVPTLVLVGSPNVGKSSLVRALSTGRPEVADYPFTTRGMTMGHVMDPVLGVPLYQVMDTPGLLPRGQDERNWMYVASVRALIRVLPLRRAAERAPSPSFPSLSVTICPPTSVTETPRAGSTERETGVKCGRLSRGWRR